MSLPKRDGIHGRYYLIHKPDTAPEVLAHADRCIQDVLDGAAKENHSGFPVVVRIPASRWSFGTKAGPPSFPASCWSGTCPNSL